MALALVVAVAAAGCASRADRSAAAGASVAAPAKLTRTSVHDFRPGQATPAKTVSGSCWTSSIAVSARLAYRCLAANQILDPCFVTSRKARAADCYASPWARPVRLRLTSKVPAPAPPLPGRHPWAIRLADGTRCVAIGGTVQIVGNVALTFSCGRTAAASLTSSSGTLRSAYFRARPGTALQRVLVSDIWYG
jgi:hypothetical protein